MIYVVEKGKADSGSIGYQNSKLYYTFSHWSGGMGKRLSSWSQKLPYKPIGPTMLVEWTDE